MPPETGNTPVQRITTDAGTNAARAFMRRMARFNDTITGTTTAFQEDAWVPIQPASFPVPDSADFNVPPLTENPEVPQPARVVVRIETASRDRDNSTVYRVVVTEGSNEVDSYPWSTNLEETRLLYQQVARGEQQRANDWEANRRTSNLRYDLRSRNVTRGRNVRPMDRNVRRMLHRPKEDNENEFKINEDAIAAEEANGVPPRREPFIQPDQPWTLPDDGFAELIGIEDDFDA